MSFNGTLIPGPTASVITAVAPTSICLGATANIRVTMTGGAGPFTVVYSNGVTTFTVNNYISGTNITISPTATRTYTIVSVTNANGAVGSGNSGSPSITVNSLPAVPTATNLSTCLVGAYTMTGGSAPPLGHTGSYSTGNPYLGPTTTFTYTVTNTVTGCSRSSTTYTFTRNTAPSISSQPSPAGAQTVCQGQAFAPITVVASASGISYLWYRNTIASTAGATAIPLSNSPTYTPPSTTVGTFYYYVRISGTCTPAVNSAFVGPITILPAAVGGTASGNQSICNGSPSDLSVTGFTSTVTKWQYASDFAFTTPVDIPASASATLASAQMGVLTATRYYRAIVANGICEAFSNVITVTYDTTTWNGTIWSNGAPTSAKAVVFDGNYNSTGDIEACSVLVNSGNVIFGNATTYPSHTLSIQNGLTITGGSLTFENNASLVQVNNVVNSGNITYKRNTTPVRKFDYTYWSSPVDLQILANLSPLTLVDKYFWFNT
ncbi:MAG: hypothetical protein ACK5XN_08400, partial [Bacteroidota bacterium]